ncbi:hypothetical protein [Branchiibius cervicis]|uniref:DNA-binding protein n=1 Tax=Branchiibius cervicis TaxID=908252 RepID=A0ABW2ANW6_9MICO
MTIKPIGVPNDWDNDHLLLFKDFCTIIQTPERTVREWRRCGRGPQWQRFNGNGALYLTVGELRRFLQGAG